MNIENNIIDISSNSSNDEPTHNNEIIESMSEWVSHSDNEMEQLAKLLTNKVTDNIEWEKLDYNLYSKHHYKKQHPKFSDEVCEILANCSNVKTHDERNVPLKIEQKETIISMT